DLPATGRSIVSAPDRTGRQAMAHALTIGRLARSAGMPAKTIRYYEEVGVLPRPPRTAAGYRQYTEDSVQRLLLIRRARALGVSLQHLKGLVVALDGGSRGALRPRLRELIRAHLGDVQRRIGELEMLRRQLEQVLHGLVGRRRMMGAGLLLIALCDVASVTTSAFGVFLGLRALGGVGWAMFGTVATTTMVDLPDGRRRGRAVSALLMSETLGLLLG